MLLSIITPTLNAGRCISQCLRSLPVDKDGQWEHLVIDGGSTDNTQTEVLSIAQGDRKNIKLIIDIGSGIYQAMNRGLREAQGRFVLFLGADDQISESAVFQFVKRTQSCGEIRDQADVFFGDVEYDNGSVVCSNSEGLMIKNTLHHQGCLYSRSRLLEIGGYNINFRILADYDLNCRLRRSSARFVHISGRISKCGARGVSTKGRWINYWEEMRIRCENFGLLPGLFFAPFSVARFLHRKARSF